RIVLHWMSPPLYWERAEHRVYIARSVRDSLSRRLEHSTTRRPSWVFSLCTRRRSRSARAKQRLQSPIRCVRCAKKQFLRARSSAYDGSSTRGGCDDSRRWKDRRTISPSGKCWAAGRLAKISERAFCL